MNLGTTTILTNRLKLKQLTFDDVQSVFSHLKSDERITDNLVAAAHTELEQTRIMVEEIIKQYDNPGFYHWHRNNRKQRVDWIDRFVRLRC